MAWKTLSIEIGGLCMYVQRNAPAGREGLYILMPLMQHPGMWHCPMLIDCTNSKGQIYSLLGQVLDLHTLVPNGATPCVIDWAFDASKFGGNKKVDDKYLTMDPPVDPLASRIWLPYGLCPDAKGYKAAKMKVKGVSGDIYLKGIAKLKINVTNPGSTLRIPGTTTDLQPDANGDISIQLLNIPNEELGRTRGRNHKKGEKADHLQAYYWMLKGVAPTMTAGPEVIIDETITDQDPPVPYNGPCRTGPVKAGGGASIFFVDTQTCSSGIGN